MSHVTAIAPALVIVMHSFPTAAVAQASSLPPPPAALATMQISGRGFEEGGCRRDYPGKLS